MAPFQRTRRVLLWACAIGFLAAVSARTIPTDSSTAEQLQHIADSLERTQQYDTLLVLLPSYIDWAVAQNDSGLLGRLLTKKASVEVRKSRSVEALRTADRAFEVLWATRDTIRAMSVMTFKAWALGLQGKTTEAMSLHKERLKFAKLTRSRQSEGWARAGIGYLHLLSGRLERSRDEYQKAVDLFQSENSPDHMISPLVGLGRAVSQLGEIEEAKRIFQRVRRMAVEQQNQVEEANAVNNLGYIEYVHGDMTLAAQYFEQAASIHENLGRPALSVVPRSNVAFAHQYLGELEEAATILLETLELCDKWEMQERRVLVLASLADVRLEQDRPREAARLFREILAMGEVAPVSKRNEATLGLALALADMDSLRAARASLESVFTNFESRSDLFTDVLIGLYLSRYMWQTGEPLGATRVVRRVLSEMEERNIEMLRGAALFELSACLEATGELDQAEAAFEQAIAESEKVRLRQAEHRWREASGQRKGLHVADRGFVMVKNATGESRTEKVERLFNIVQRFKARTLVERMTEPRKLGLGIRTAPAKPTTLLEMQEEIVEPGELVLDFLVGNERTLMFAVTQYACRLVELPGLKSDMREMVELYCGQIGRASGSQQPWQHLADAQRILGGLIFGDVADLIEQSSLITVMPDGFLNAVPFGTLRIADDMLMTSKRFQRAPSTTILRLSRSTLRIRENSSVLALGAKGDNILSGASREIAGLRTSYKNIEVREGLDGDMSRVLSGYDVIHVAAHIEVNDEKPWHSGILLGADAREKGDTRSASVDFAGVDPFLRAASIARMEIPGQLAFLSGCESASGRLTGGEGVLGLTAAFLSAGVPTIVATLWKVDDRTTSVFVDDFYRRLASGETVANAVRDSQLFIKERDKTSHPFYWAGFVVVGNGNATISLTPREKRKFPLAMATFSGLLGLVAIIWMLRRKNG